MKKLTLLFVSMVITNICFAQVNYTIPMDSTSAWRIWHSSWDGTGGGTWTSEGRVFVAGDTTINNVVYTKLSNSGLRIFSFEGHTSTFHFSDPIYALIRADSNRTYLLFDNEEFLLYDFSLQVGDTLPETFINGNTVIVSDIDTVVVAGKQLKRFHIYDPVQYINSTWFIEGIGHEYGLIESMNITMDFGAGFECYAENGIAVFPEGSDCDLTVDVNKVLKPETELIISPNPSQGLFTLTFTSNTTKEVEIEIASVRGEIITTTKWKIQAGQNERTFNLKSLSPGLYVVLIRDGKGIANTKILINK